MELSNINNVQNLLKKSGLSLKKSLGQNFLIDGTVCPAMANAACDADAGVLEIGPGIGVLTRELSKKSKKVVAIEIDERLKQILSETLAECNNVKVIYGDCMKLDLNKIIKDNFGDCRKIAVCANLPYYITSPIIMMLLESRLPIDSITVMVQKEAAERLCADVGTREAGTVTVAVSYYAQKEILFGVDRSSFLPAPNVDSSVIQLKILKNPPVNVKDEEWFFKVAKACFAQRRKTLVNTVSNSLGISKDYIKAALSEMNLSETIRGEQLTLKELANLSDILLGKPNV